LAADGDSKDKKSPLDGILEGDDAIWDAALDDWDDAFDGIEAPGAPAEPAKAAKSAPVPDAPTGQIDPLVDLISGEMELPEAENGEALGTLLGSRAAAPSRPAKKAPQAPVEDRDIGIHPDEVTGAEVEVEIGSWGDRSATKAVEEEPTPAVVSPAVVEEEATPIVGMDGPIKDEKTPVALVPLDEPEEVVSDFDSGESNGEDLDIGDLMDGLGRDEDEPPSVAERTPIREAEQVPDIPALFAPDAEDETSPPPLDIFDEIVPIDDETPGEAIEAGEVLPRPSVQPEPEQFVTELPVQLDDEGLEEPPLALPEIPEELITVDLTGFEAPEQGDPIRPPSLYWERLSDYLQLEAGLTETTTRAAALEITVAQAFEAIGEKDEAITHFREVLHHQPGNLPAMRELRRLLTASGQQDQVAEQLAEMAPRAGDLEARAILHTRAEILWSTTGDDTGARGLLDEVGDARGGDLRGLLLRADLAVATSDDEALSEAVSALADAIEDGRSRAALVVEQGRMDEAAGRYEAARQAYRRALESESDNSGAVEGLARAGAKLDDPKTLAAALGAGALPAGIWSARRLRRQASLGRNHKLESVDQLAVLKRARELAGDDPLILEELAQALRAAGEHGDAVEAFVALGQVAPEPEQRSLALLDAAIISEDKLDDLTRAAELYERASDICSEAAAITVYTKQLQLSEKVSLDERVNTHTTAASALQGEERVVHHLAAATLLEREPERSEQATAQLLECLEHDPSCRQALWRIERHYRKAGQLEQLAATLDTAAAATENPTFSRELRAAAAQLYEGGLGQPEHALMRHRQILEEEPENTQARLGLVRALTALGRHDELAEHYAEEAQGAEDPAVAARLYSRSGDHRSDDAREEAAAAYRSALDKVPEHLASSFKLLLQSANEGRWEEVGEIWSAWLEALPEGAPQRKSIMMRLGGLREFELDDEAGALASYEAAVAEPNPATGAMEGLTRMLRKAEATDRLAQELERELTLTSNPGERFAILVAAGELAERSGQDWRESEQRLKRALEEAPGHPIARRALEQLYISQAAWQQLADLLMSDLQEAGSVPARVKAYERLAELDLQRADERSAGLSYESIADLDPSHLPALRFLQRSALKDERYSDLLLPLWREIQRSEGTADAASLWLELGRLLSNHPEVIESFRQASDEGEGEGQAEAVKLAAFTAKDAFLAALEADPNCIFGLRRMVDDAWAREDVVELRQLYLRLATAVGLGREAAIFLTRAAELGEASDLSAYQEAVANHPESLAPLHYLRDAALRIEDWEAAADAADAEAKRSLHPPHRAHASLLGGELALRELGQTERAMTAFMDALRTDPSDLRAFERLAEFLEQAERWEELAELLTNRAKAERSRVRLTAHHRKLAEIARDRLEDNDRAKLHLRVLLKLHKEDREALSGLADLYTMDGQWAEAANALIRLARQEKDQQALCAIFLRLGRIYQDETPDLARAIASFKKVVALDSDNLEAYERLSRIYLKDLDYDKALEAASELLERQGNPEERVATLLMIAKIHEDGLKDQHQATIAYRQALEIAPMDLDAIAEVIGFFVRQGDQRSLMIHLDRSVATMRARLKHDPFDAFAYKALFKIFGWRKSPDGCFCSAQVLDTLGQAEAEERSFISSRLAAVGAPGQALGDPEYDEWLFDRSIPGGFRQVFKLLNDSFVKHFPLRIGDHGAGRGDRLADIDHPVRRIGDALANDFGVEHYEIYVLKSKPASLIVTNDPPAVLVGRALLHEATEEEILFVLGRSLWLIKKAMILPASLRPEDLTMLVAGLVRQYSPEFQPEETDAKALRATTKKVGKAIPRKLRQELMPFALECSGSAVELQALGASVVHSANRAGLLTSRSVFGALTALCKMAGHASPPRDPLERIKLLRGNVAAEELLRFAVSDPYFELRRGMHVAVR
jgi:tetratricopeptide (TPR) repeat protein